MGTSGRAITKSTSMSGEMYTLEHNDGSQSDTAVGTVGAGGKKRRSSLSAKVVAIVSRRSRSTSQLSQTGEWYELKNLKFLLERWSWSSCCVLWWALQCIDAKNVYFCFWKPVPCVSLFFFSVQLSNRVSFVNPKVVRCFGKKIKLCLQICKEMQRSIKEPNCLKCKKSNRILLFKMFLNAITSNLD